MAAAFPSLATRLADNGKRMHSGPRLVTGVTGRVFWHPAGRTAGACLKLGSSEAEVGAREGVDAFRKHCHACLLQHCSRRPWGWCFGHGAGLAPSSRLAHLPAQCLGASRIELPTSLFNWMT